MKPMRPESIETLPEAGYLYCKPTGSASIEAPKKAIGLVTTDNYFLLQKTR